MTQSVSTRAHGSSRRRPERAARVRLCSSGDITEHWRSTVRDSPTADAEHCDSRGTTHTPCVYPQSDTIMTLMSASILVSAALIVLAVLGLVLVRMYRAGGGAAIRRQLPQLTLLALVLVAVTIGVPLLMTSAGDVVLLLLLVSSSVVALMWWQRRPRRG